MFPYSACTSLLTFPFSHPSSLLPFSSFPPPPPNFSLSVPYTDAILGATVKVAVVDGEVEIKVAPGTQPGQVLRIKGKGAPRLGNASQRGDHYVTIKVEIPKDLGDKERELVEKLKEVVSKK